MSIDHEYIRIHLSQEDIRGYEIAISFHNVTNRVRVLRQHPHVAISQLANMEYSERLIFTVKWVPHDDLRKTKLGKLHNPFPDPSKQANGYSFKAFCNVVEPHHLISLDRVKGDVERGVGNGTDEFLSFRCPLGCHWKEQPQNLELSLSPQRWSKLHMPSFKFSIDSAPVYLPEEGIWYLVDGDCGFLASRKILIFLLNYEDSFSFTLLKINERTQPLVVKARNLRASFGSKFLTSEFDLEFQDLFCWDLEFSPPSIWSTKGTFSLRTIITLLNNLVDIQSS